MLEYSDWPSYNRSNTLPKHLQQKIPRFMMKCVLLDSSNTARSINILLLWMKQQKQKVENDQQSYTRFHFTVQCIHIKVKFSCRLYLEYLGDEESRKSKEVRIDQKNHFYRMDEQIDMLIGSSKSKGKDCEQSLNISVKLMSSKGLAFTAGIISINKTDFQHFPEVFTLKFNKSQDFDVYCDCRRIQSTLGLTPKKMENHENVGESSTVCVVSRPQAIEVGHLQDTSRMQSKKHDKNCEGEINKTSRHSLNVILGHRQVERRGKKYECSLQQYRQREKELLHKIEDLQSEVHKNCVLFEKQKQIIFLLQSKQVQASHEKNQLKEQIKTIQHDVEQKRQKIRELEGEKLKLLMNALQSEKQVAALKQKIGSSLEMLYESIRNMFRQKNRKFIRDFGERQAIADRGKQQSLNSFSKIVRRERDTHKSPKYKQCYEESSKVSFSAVRGLINKQVDQAWLEESLGFRELNPSSVLSNTLNDMSISDINGKAKEVSLLNSDLFLKIPESQPLIRSSSKSKQFTSQIGKSIKKIQDMVAVQIQQTISSFAQMLDKNKNAGKDGSSVDQSLLGYLQQLENGFERQLGALGQKQKIILYYEQLIEQLNQKLSQKQNLVFQLEEQLFKLQEERDQLRSEIHESNYAHALKEEQFINKIHILQHGKIMPNYSSSSSPTKPLVSRKQPKIPSKCYEQQLIEHKQHLRMMEIDLLHERDQRAKATHSLHKKQLQLQQVLIEKRRLEFAMKIRERMTCLNESIELSVQQEKSLEPKSNEKFTQQSLGNEDYANMLFCQQ